MHTICALVTGVQTCALPISSTGACVCPSRLYPFGYKRQVPDLSQRRRDDRAVISYRTCGDAPILVIPEGAREHPAPEPTRRAAAADLPLRVRQDVRLDHLLHQQVRCRLVGAVDRDRVREAALLQLLDRKSTRLTSSH